MGLAQIHRNDVSDLSFVNLPVPYNDSFLSEPRGIGVFHAFEEKAAFLRMLKAWAYFPCAVICCRYSCIFTLRHIMFIALQVICSPTSLTALIAVSFILIISMGLVSR